MSKVVVGFCLCVLASFVQAQDEDFRYTQSDFGGVGILQMPSARMNPEGEFSFFLYNVSPYTRAGIAVQPYSWMEALFRYTNISNRLFGPDIAGNQDYKDKAFDLKLRLLEESYYWPELSIGLRDIGGTGLFSGEYIVANKQYGEFDFTLGMAWGYLGAGGGFTNPLTYLSDRFEGRSARTGEGGEFSLGNYFSGEEAALFAGVEYHPKWAPLIFKAELDGNDYQNEPQNNNQPSSSPFNFGVVYKLNENVDLSLAWERGEELMLGFTLRTNYASSPGQVKLNDPKPASYFRTQDNLPGKISSEVLSSELHEKAGFRVGELYRNDTELFVVGRNEAYRNKAKSLGRVARVVLKQAPEDVKWISVVEQEKGQSMEQLSISRTAFESVLLRESDLDSLWAATELSEPAYGDASRIYQADGGDRFRYRIGPGFTQSIGGPDGFILYEISARLSAELDLQKNTWLAGSVSSALVSNFDKFEYTAPSNLPRVRTNIREYLTTSEVRMNNLQITHFEKLNDDWFALGYAGYLEGMFGGVGAEVLYAPFGENWALGADLNYVHQREFDMRFGLRDYSVLTGHASLYHELPWLPKTLAKISVGRYLAKDLGITFDLSRSFESGVLFGAWATFTDVSAEQFGEGSFDKGVYVSLPFDLFLTESTRQSARLNWTFLTRDGGQRLAKRYQLHDLVVRGDKEGLKKGFKAVLD